MNPQASPQPLDFAAYLALEQHAEARHELLAGELRAMAGAAENHVKITGNLFALLWNHLRGSPCVVYASDMKLKAGPDCYYPDVFVSCDPADAAPLVKQRPLLIAEVLSDSTESQDKGRKLINYLNIPGLREYLLISQASLELLLYRDTPRGWELKIFRGQQSVFLESVNLRFELAELYGKVRF